MATSKNSNQTQKRWNEIEEEIKSILLQPEKSQEELAKLIVERIQKDLIFSDAADEKAVNKKREEFYKTIKDGIKKFDEEQSAIKLLSFVSLSLNDFLLGKTHIIFDDTDIMNFRTSIQDMLIRGIKEYNEVKKVVEDFISEK